jgi:hypothetical protein
MKKNYLIAMLVFITAFVNAQIERTSYRGAFAPTGDMWTKNWTNWDPKNAPYTDGTTAEVTADIVSNVTWHKGTTYYLNGLIYVRNNATLTIEAGTIIKGRYTNTGTALVVTKGAKLNAIGTAVDPIVFTSAKTVAQGRAAADWGGVVLLGKASLNIAGGTNNVEGITTSVNTEFGGGATPNDNDSSGTLKYVRIEFGGFVFSPNNEINGLTFGAVGRGTTIDNVQVSYSGDDSFEWFGGTVNCKHLVAYRGLDDDFDTDNGFSGVCQFGLGIRDPEIADNPAISTSEGFESDNDANGSSNSPFTTAIFTNYTLIGPAYRATLSPALSVASGHARLARLRRNSKQQIFNSVFLDFKNNFLFVDGTAAVANANAGSLKFKNNIIGGPIETAYAGGVNPTSLNTWFTNSANALVALSKDVLTTPYGTSSSDYTNVDYRPQTTSAAYGGASFADAVFTPYLPVAATPTVTNVKYCKGDITSPVTALLGTGGVSLKWYSSKIVNNVVVFNAAISTPTPSSSKVGVTTYFVSQLDAANVESDKVRLDVTVNAIPSVKLGAITGVFNTVDAPAAPLAVGSYVGTTTELKYTVDNAAAALETGVVSYLWTVPNGVNIISGQGTNSIVVNLKNVPAGAGALGSILVSSVNDLGCSGVPARITLTKALPAAPAKLTLTDSSANVITNYAKYMGSSTSLTLTADSVVGASSYKWELPAGVNVVTTGAATPTPVVKYYASEPFLSSNTEAAITAGGKPGQKYYAVTYNTYTVDVNGVSTDITFSTAQLKIYNGNLPGAEVTVGYGNTKTQDYPLYGTVVTSNKPAILVNFAGVTSSAITKLYLGAKSVNGVGNSTTPNTANPDFSATGGSTPGLTYPVYSQNFTPASGSSSKGTNASQTYTLTADQTASTAKLKKLTATVPSAVKTVTGQLTAVCGDSSYTYTIAASALASSYKIIAPTNSVVTSASNSANVTNELTTSDLVFTVKYPTSFSAPKATPQSIAVTAVNNVGPSLTAKSILVSTDVTAPKLVGTAPAYYSTAGDISFTVSQVEGATQYVASLPANSTATIVSVVDNVITVNCNAVTAATLTVNVIAKNSCGTPSKNLAVKLTKGSAPIVKLAAQTIATEVYPNPVSGTFNVDVTATTASIVEVTVYSFDGTIAVSPKAVKLQAGNNTISQDVSSLNKGIYFVQIANSLTNEVIVKKLIKG